MILVSAQSIAAQWRGMQFERFDAHDGLNSDFITSICQDSIGFIYFGGYQQLIRYDGHVFEDYTHDPTDSTSIGPGQISQMLVARDGKIWLAMRRHGLIVFDPKTESFQSFKSPVSNRSISTLIEDDKGFLWAGTDEITLLRFDRTDNQFIKYSPSKELIPNISSGSIAGIVQDKTDLNILWLTIFAHEEEMKEPYMPYYLLSFNTSTLEFTPEVCRGIVKIQDEKGFLWGGSWNNGLWRYDPENKVCENIRFDISLPSGNHPGDGVFSIRQFKDTYWVGSRNSILTFSNDLNYSFITKSDHYGAVNAIEQDRDQNIWIGTTNGLMVAHPQSQHISYYALSELGSQERIYPGRLAYDSNDDVIYLINRNEPRIYKIPLDQKTEPSVIKTQDRLYGICTDKNNRLIVATQSSLFWANPDSDQLEKLKPRGGNEVIVPWLWSMESHPNGLVGGIGSNDFFWYDDDHHIRQLHHPQEVSTTASYTRMFFTDTGDVILSGGAENHKINITSGEDRIIYSPDNGHIIQDKQGMYWLGTISTIGRYQLKNDSLKLVKYYTSADGLTNITATHLHLDHKGRIWVFSNGGLSVIDPVLNETRNVGVPEGLPVSNNDPVQVLNLPDGRICTVNDIGLIVFHPDSLWSATTQPVVPVVIKDLHIEGKPDLTKKNLNFIKTLSLKPNQNTLNIQFQGLAFPRDRLVNYCYKVDGLHHNWIDLGKNNSVTLSQIPPGKYVFQVKTGTPESQTPVKSLAFHIATPLYLQTWFVISCLLLIMSGIFLIYRTRIKYIKKQAEEKTRINKQLAELELKALRSQMNPHFMFNSLNSIKNYILKNETTKASEYLSSFSHLIRMILQNSREKTVSLQDEMDTLLLYIDLEKLRFRNGFEFTCQIDNNIDISTVQIPTMVVQPFVENAIWHGLLHKDGDRHLTLRIYKSEGDVVCEIEDDGIGRKNAADIKSKSATQYKSMGMGITQDRITLLNSMSALGIQVEIIDKTDRHGTATGTLVKITIPHESNNY